MNLAIFHYYSAKLILELQCSVILRCYTAKSFSIAHCSIILYCYNAQPFSLLQCSPIPHAKGAQSFIIAIVLSHFHQKKVFSHSSMLQYSVIFCYYSARGHYVILQNDRAQSRSQACARGRRLDRGRAWG
jgi:hypothetical protein